MKRKAKFLGKKINKPFFITSKWDEKDMQEYLTLNKRPILYVKSLTKRYFAKKLPAIQQISFNVFPGEFHAFIGANGAGKTTTIKCLIGAYINWNGTILVNGFKNSMEFAKRKLGYIPENARFPEKLSSLKYLQWMTMLSGLTRKNAKSFAVSKLKSLKMWSLRHKSPNSFSSGQKKKILLAQALIHDPDVIIMDEPVANLDPKARTEFFDLLMELKKKGKAIFISSHVLAELDRYADSATILDGGKIIYSGDKHTLIKKFVSYQYEVATNNDKLAHKYFLKKHIKYRKSNARDITVVDFHNDANAYACQKELIRKGIVFERFLKIEPSLDQVYNKLIVKGSVDTQEE